jgi:hypothetical protein
MDRETIWRKPPNRGPSLREDIDFAAQELLEIPEADLPAMLENIAKALKAEFANQTVDGAGGHCNTWDAGVA